MEDKEIKLKCLEIAKQFSFDADDLLAKANKLFEFVKQLQSYS